MVLISTLTASALALAIQAQEPAAPPNYVQSSVCEIVGRRVLTLLDSVEEGSGETDDTRALRGQADGLVAGAVAAREAALATEGLSEDDRAGADALIAERLGGADQAQFENAVLNCFTLFGIE